MKLFKTILVVFGLLFSVSSGFAEERDGKWSFTFETTRGGCSGTPGQVTVKDGKIRGTIFSKDMGNLPVTGKVRNDGSFRGSLGGSLGSFKGKITNNTGTGTWRDISRCRGTMKVRKL